MIFFSVYSLSVGTHRERKRESFVVIFKKYQQNSSSIIISSSTATAATITVSKELQTEDIYQIVEQHNILLVMLLLMLFGCCWRPTLDLTKDCLFIVAHKMQSISYSDFKNFCIPYPKFGREKFSNIFKVTYTYHPLLRSPLEAFYIAYTSTKSRFVAIVDFVINRIHFTLCHDFITIKKRFC